MAVLRSFSRILIVTGVLFGFATGAEAGPILQAQTVLISYQLPAIGTTFTSKSVVVGAGVEWQGFNFGMLDVNLSDTNILITFTSSGTWGSQTFTGFAFFDELGLIPSFAGATLNPASTMQGLAQSAITFDNDHIWVNWRNLPFSPQQFVSIDITAASELPTPVPEPATWTLVVAGLTLGAGLLRSRRVPIS